MIHVTRLDGTELVINSDLILVVDRTPDTLITMVNGDRFLLRDPVEDVIEKTVSFRRKLYREPGPATGQRTEAGGNDRPPVAATIEFLQREEE